VEGNKTVKAFGVKGSLDGNRPLIKYNFWATRKAVCPEPFIAINLDPGQELEWTTRYTLFTTNAGR